MFEKIAFALACIALICNARIYADANVSCAKIHFGYTPRGSIYSLEAIEKGFSLNTDIDSAEHHIIPAQSSSGALILMRGIGFDNHFLTKYNGFLYIDDSVSSESDFSVLRVSLVDGSFSRYHLPGDGVKAQTRYPAPLSASRNGATWIFPISHNETLLVDLRNGVDTEYIVKQPFRIRGYVDFTKRSISPLYQGSHDVNLGYLYLEGEQPTGIAAPPISAIFQVTDEARWGKDTIAIEITQVTGLSQTGRGLYVISRHFNNENNSYVAARSTEPRLFDFQYDGANNKFLWFQLAPDDDRAAVFRSDNERLEVALNELHGMGWAHFNVLDQLPDNRGYVLAASRGGKRKVWDLRLDEAGQKYTKTLLCSGY